MNSNSIDNSMNSTDISIDNKSLDNSIDNSMKDIHKDISIHSSSNGRVYNIQNLKPYNKTDNRLSSEEAKRRGRAGAKKSAEVKRQRKTMRETILSMLEKEISPEKLAEYGIDSADMSDNTYQSALIASMLREALNGSEKAMTLVRDTIGEAPALRTENKTELITKEDVKVMDNLKKYLTS